jgi:hypothetical protein
MSPNFTLFVGPSGPTRNSGARSHSGGLKAAKVPRQRSSLHQRPKDGEGVELEVYLIDNVIGWTHVVSLFVGHENICKSQRTVMIL